MNKSVKNQRNKAAVWDYWQRMNHAKPTEIEAIVKKAFHKNVNWNGSQPINQIRGVDALITEFSEPLRHAFPDIQRTPYILMGGENNGEEWVSGYGYLTGTFVNDWLGIPATRTKTHINYGQFFVMKNEKIIESYAIFDTLSVMKQAGFQVLPPAYGQEGGKLMKPRGSDGIMLTQQDDLEGRKTMQLVEEMAGGLMRYNRNRDGENMDTMEQEHYWHPDFHWMGPTGIGSSHTIEEFQDYHQRPWLLGFGDRGIDVDPGGRVMGSIGEGKYASGGIWDVAYSRHHGTYQGIPATENVMTLRDFDWYKRDGSYLIQNWIPIDLVDLCLQMDIDLFDRMRRQIILKKRGINWWDLPLQESTASLAGASLREF